MRPSRSSSSRCSRTSISVQLVMYIQHDPGARGGGGSTSSARPRDRPESANRADADDGVAGEWVARQRATCGRAVGRAWVLATLLAVIGLYGVMAYTVTRRTREVGIRMALGARAGLVAWLFLREAMILVSAGCAVGVSSVWACGRYVESQSVRRGASRSAHNWRRDGRPRDRRRRRCAGARVPRHSHQSASRAA